MKWNRSNRKMETTKLNWLTVVLAIALAGGGTVASADVMLLNPTDQSDVNADSPNTIFSAQTYSRAGWSATGAESPDDLGGSRIWTTYLKFVLPANAGTITGFSLSLDLIQVSGTQTPMGVWTRRALGDTWTAATLTFNNAPGSSGTGVFSNNISSTMTLTQDVWSLTQSPQTSVGFGDTLSLEVYGLDNNGSQTDNAWVRIGKAGGSGLAPVLTISYIPEPATASLLLMASGLCVLARRKNRRRD